MFQKFSQDCIQPLFSDSRLEFCVFLGGFRFSTQNPEAFLRPRGQFCELPMFYVPMFFVLEGFSPLILKKIWSGNLRIMTLSEKNTLFCSFYKNKKCQVWDKPSTQTPSCVRFWGGGWHMWGGLHMKGDMSLLTEQKTSNVKVTPVVWEIATLADFVNIFIFF